MDKLIRQRDALDAVTKYCTMYDLRELLSDIDSLPSAEPRCIATIQFSQEQLDEAFENVKADILSVKPKAGKWKEKEVFTADESKSIDEWQSCCCSECGRYDTQPYMYYFREPNYCSWCGAKMEVKDG